MPLSRTTCHGFAYKLIADLIAATLPRRHRHH
jgi:hypothetical protein